MFLTIIENSPSDLEMVYSLCILKIAPDWMGIEMGIGDSILMKSISSIVGRSVQQLRESMNEIGDLGEVAMMSMKGQKKINSFFVKKV